MRVRRGVKSLRLVVVCPCRRTKPPVISDTKGEKRLELLGKTKPHMVTEEPMARVSPSLVHLVAQASRPLSLLSYPLLRSALVRLCFPLSTITARIGDSANGCGAFLQCPIPRHRGGCQSSRGCHWENVDFVHLKMISLPSASSVLLMYRAGKSCFASAPSPDCCDLPSTSTHNQAYVFVGCSCATRCSPPPLLMPIKHVRKSARSHSLRLVCVCVNRSRKLGTAASGWRFTLSGTEPWPVFSMRSKERGSRWRTARLSPTAR